MRYSLTSPLRLLLPFSAIFIAFPIIFEDELMNMIALPVFFFFGSYFFFLNFPRIGEILHEKPLYLQDLIVAREGITDETFKMLYSIIMNFMLAFLFTSFCEYLIIRGVKDKPIIEVCAVIGGNLSIYVKLQYSIGKLMLTACHYLKQKNERLLDSQEQTEIEMVNIHIKEEDEIEPRNSVKMIFNSLCKESHI